jgi:hypothetical protein
MKSKTAAIPDTNFKAHANQTRAHNSWTLNSSMSTFGHELNHSLLITEEQKIQSKPRFCTGSSADEDVQPNCPPVSMKMSEDVQERSTPTPQLTVQECPISAGHELMSRRRIARVLQLRTDVVISHNDDATPGCPHSFSSKPQDLQQNYSLAAPSKVNNGEGRGEGTGEGQ